MRYVITLNILQNIEKSARKRSLQNDMDLGAGEMFNRCTSADKCEAKNSKRQKILNSDHNGSKLPCYENKSSECKLEPKFGDSLSRVQSTVISDPSNANRSVCAFCDSSKLTDVSYIPESNISSFLFISRFMVMKNKSLDFLIITLSPKLRVRITLPHILKIH